MPISTVLAGHPHVDALVGGRIVTEFALRPLEGAEAVAASPGSQRADGAPEETMDRDGFLKEDDWSRDITHADFADGRLMLAKTLAELNA